MKIVQPVTVTDAILTANSVAETVALYNAGTSYSIGDLVRSDTTHRVYESLANANLGNALTDASKWLDTGPTNPWAMFDNANSSQTSASDSISVTLAPGSRVDHIGLLNMYAISVQVIATSTADGEVYNETYSLVSTSGITDWYEYFTAPIDVETDKVITDIPALYTDLSIQVVLSYTSETVLLGALVLGLAKELGGTVYGATTGIIDYSRKVTDDYGNTSITERGYANRGNFRIVCDNSNIVSIQRKLAEYRAVPALYVGSDDYSNTFIFGFYRDFDISIDYPTISHCTLSLEGLI